MAAGLLRALHSTPSASQTAFPLYNATLDAQLFTGMNLKMLLPPPEDPSQAMKPGSEVSSTQEAQRLAAWVENGAWECPKGSRAGHARAL